MSTAENLSEILIEESSENESFINEVLKDFYICCLSREVSYIGRKEVLTGKAKFGILGDGKEVAQVAMARSFEKGDHRAGYYRDQTLMFSLGLANVEQFFAQLYADPENDPFSGGRQMNAHFATPYIDDNGNWLDQKERYNISADISPTGGQMARSLGLAYASKKYASNPALKENMFSKEGREVCFCTIGDASTSEGIFFETVNAAAVIQAPLAISVWDDGYGISVPRDLQTTKDSISKALQGFAVDADSDDRGLLIFKAKGWDYPGLLEMYEKGIKKVRKSKKPAIFHVEEVTQPQGHSTSGSHERYKDEHRLQFEQDYDCIEKMAEWMIETKIASEEKVKQIREKAKADAKKGKKNAWKTHRARVDREIETLSGVIDQMESELPAEIVDKSRKEIKGLLDPNWSEVVDIARKLRVRYLNHTGNIHDDLESYLETQSRRADQYYHTHLQNEGRGSALEVPVVAASYSEDGESVPGYQVLNRFFDHALEKYPELYAFGEDLGKIGDVNQGFAGLQEKYGEERVFDTGIREWSIVGQAIGMAMRGLRPIAEIQYLDYLMYAISPLSDDLATVRYRSNGIQKAPAIIRTRGHRLEGIWHAGSPLGAIVHALRGMHILVPRNMTQAAGFYNTLLQSDDPALVIECLNGYRLREPLPKNIGEYTVPLGRAEILREGDDVTLATYGSCVRIADEAAQQLEEMGISVEIVDVQSLLPFDLENTISASLEKTNRIVFLDEDVPGGATAYMMQKVLQEQNGYFHLDTQPTCITARPHRPPYGSDGDYFSKPSPAEVVETIYNLMNEYSPVNFPHQLKF